MQLIFKVLVSYRKLSRIIINRKLWLWRRLWLSQEPPLFTFMLINHIKVLRVFTSHRFQRIRSWWGISILITILINYFPEVYILSWTSTSLSLLGIYIYCCFGTILVIVMWGVFPFDWLCVILMIFNIEHVSNSNTCKPLNCIFFVHKWRGPVSVIELLKRRVVRWTACSTT